MTRNILVIHSAGDLAYLERLRQVGFRFTLIKKCPTDEDRQRFDRVVDFDYQQGMQATLELIDTEHARVTFDGVVSFSESGVIMAAVAAKHLGLPGNPAGAALRARNKYLMRCALRDTGLPSPHFGLVRDAQQALQMLQEVGQPMVLKPISGSSSYGVTRLDPGDSLEDIDRHLCDVRSYISAYRDNNPRYPFEFWLPEAGHGVALDEVFDPAEAFLLEGFLGGQQVSVDGFVSNSQINTCGVIAIERVKGSDYFLEYEEWMPSRRSTRDEAAIEAVTRQAVTAIGLRNGPFHCELKVSDEGIHVIELAARRGADNIADFLQRVMGVDIYEEAVRIACGEARGRARLTPHRHMKMRYFLPQKAGQLVAIGGAEQVRQHPGVSELVLDVEPGDSVLVPPAGFEFLGYVSVAAPTAAAADELLDEVYRQVQFHVALASSAAPIPGRLLVVEPSLDYAIRVRQQAPEAVFLASPARAVQLAGFDPIAADLHDPAAALDAVHAAIQAAGNLAGISCFVCDHLPLTAWLAVELGLPFHSTQSVEWSRHKQTTQARWQAAGLTTPATTLVRDLPDLLDFGARTVAPWILKPTNRSGSEWVLRVDDPLQLPQAHRRMTEGLAPLSTFEAGAGPEYLAQTLIEGREISADLHFAEGRLVQVLRCSEKLLVQQSGLAGLVGAYFPAQLEQGLRRALDVTFESAGRALGVRTGIVMIDGILRDGVLYLLEMGLRPGGDCLPDLSRLSNGYDPIRAACQVALGLPLDKLTLHGDKVAAMHLMTSHQGTVTRLDLHAVATHPAVISVEPYRVPGDTVRCWAGSYDDRIVASCMVRYETAAHLPALLDQLTAGVQLELTEPCVTTPPMLEAL